MHTTRYFSDLHNFMTKIAVILLQVFFQQDKMCPTQTESAGLLQYRSFVGVNTRDVHMMLQSISPSLGIVSITLQTVVHVSINQVNFVSQLAFHSDYFKLFYFRKFAVALK
jgi:hypothetical protein